MTRGHRRGRGPGIAARVRREPDPRRACRGLQEHHHALRGTLLSVSMKVFCFQPYFLRHLARFLEKLHDGALQCRGRHFYFLAVRVERGGESHDFGYRHLGCRADSGHTLRKLHDEGLGAVQFCDRWLTVEPTFSIASRTPYICSMPKIFDSLAIVCVAPSPRSTSATFIMEAASTYSLTD